MPRAKIDKKIMGEPMFPRGHINDTQKGGPRAPPRNKMALYEQLSSPSQKQVLLHNKPVQAEDPFHPASTSRGTGHEKSCSGHSGFRIQIPAYVQSIQGEDEPRKRHKVDENSPLKQKEKEMGNFQSQWSRCKTVQTSGVNSIRGLDVVLSPSHVVARIGLESYLNARKHLVNQEKQFAIQVFELHRLIKVQKLMCNEPDILLEDPNCEKSPSKTLTLDLSIQTTNPGEPLEKLSPPDNNIQISVTTPETTLVGGNDLNQWFLPIMSPDSEGPERRITPNTLPLFPTTSTK